MEQLERLLGVHGVPVPPSPPDAPLPPRAPRMRGVHAVPAPPESASRPGWRFFHGYLQAGPHGEGAECCEDEAPDCDGDLERGDGETVWFDAFDDEDEWDEEDCEEECSEADELEAEEEEQEEDEDDEDESFELEDSTTGLFGLQDGQLVKLGDLKRLGSSVWSSLGNAFELTEPWTTDVTGLDGSYATTLYGGAGSSGSSDELRQLVREMRDEVESLRATLRELRDEVQRRATEDLR